jgi:hypothetical protein
MEKVLFAEMPSSVNLAGRTATEIAGGVDAAMPHQAAVIKVGFSFTIVPTKTAGMGYSNV